MATVNANTLENQPMGRTLVDVRVTNATDSINASSGLIPSEKVRSTSVQFLVDTGASLVCLPPSVIARLGLVKVRERKTMTATGIVARNLYSTVTIEIMDRDATVEVMEVSEGVPPLRGFIPLEALDLVVNPKSQKLEGNPAHDGKFIIDCL